MTREQGTGNREQGTGNRETLLFVTYVGFFPFTYLIRFYLINKLRNMSLSLNLLSFLLSL
ncbi:hypothetical protein PN480_17095 [Dolichospermum circinale CS-1225]|uniref:hypothetical protein n=1 Tax=Dolichospermum circinale TaxID=109265 RepID=UPI00232CBA39|nr:hypothetical protein [Dolichospermum circinale]MDB9523647.1 hypothetical protein [Dolichospermum circinale CS-1225]